MVTMLILTKPRRPATSIAVTTVRADGSVWSQQLGAWVSTSHSPRGCDELNTQITEAERWMNHAKRVAAEEASRGGISQSDIKTVSAALDLED